MELFIGGHKELYAEYKLSFKPRFRAVGWMIICLDGRYTEMIEVFCGPGLGCSNRVLPMLGGRARHSRKKKCNVFYNYRPDAF
jgi:hypothetical protein